MAGLLVLALAGAALVREVRMPTGPGQVLLVPLVAAVLVAVAFGARVPATARWLLMSTAAAWLAGSWMPDFLLAHQGFLLLALLALPASRLSLVDILAVPMGVLVGSGKVVPAVTTACFAVVAAVALRRRSDSDGRSVSAALAAGLMSITVAVLATLGELAPGWLHPDVRLVVYEGILLTCGAVITWGAIGPRGRDLVDVTLGHDLATGLDGLQLVLAEALRDPSLAIEPVRLAHRPARAISAQEGASRVATEVRDGGRVLAVLRHRPTTLADPPTHAAVVEAVRLVAAEEERRHELEVRLAQLTAARRRVDTAADRRRTANATLLRRDVLAIVESVMTDLRGLVTASEDPADGHALPNAVRELESAVEETERLIWGAPHAGLGGGRLVPALQDVVRRCPVPTVLEVDGVVSATPEVEAALFYVCAEALVNVHKHASASGAHVLLRVTEDQISLVVTDDGTGGADAEGSGLIGLRDRMSAVGGRLRVDSPPGAGTTVVAVTSLSAPAPKERSRGTTMPRPRGR